jgi:type I restriction enzyme S subunit
MKCKQYPAYKDSGVEWLGETPEGWRISGIKHRCLKITDGAHVSPETVGGVYPFISTADLKQSGIDFENCLTTTPESYVVMVRGGCKPVAGDVLFSKDGTVGKTIVIKDEREFVVASSLIIVRPNKRLVQPCFLNYLFQADFLGAQVDRFVKGTALRRLSIQNLLFVQGVFPPMDEQTRIVDFLDRETEKIDTLIAKQERLIKLLQEKRQALISLAVTKGLNPDAPMKPSGVEWLGDVPAKWKIQRLRHLSGGLAVGLVINPSTYVAAEGVPFLFGGNIQPGRIDAAGARRITPEDSRKLAASMLRTGDLVTVRVGFPGITACVPPELDGCNCASMLIVRRSSRFVPAWLCYAMNSWAGKVQVELVQYGAAQEQFNLSHAVDFTYAVPPLDEQDRIVATLDSACTKLDNLKSKAQQAIAFMRERRTALISAAVTGKIDVREPAHA